MNYIDFYVENLKEKRERCWCNPGAFIIKCSSGKPQKKFWSGLSNSGSKFVFIQPDFTCKIHGTLLKDHGKFGIWSSDPINTNPDKGSRKNCFY